MNSGIYREWGFAVILGLAMLTGLASPAAASDWARFHGPNGSGISPDTKPLPIKWSETENLKWKCKLPGPGSSSPIVVGRRLFVTCWTGYAADRDNLGDQKDLRRHLLCLDRDTGKVLWDKSVEPVLPEIPTAETSPSTATRRTRRCPMVSECMFSWQNRRLAFDLDGKQLWQTGLGTGSGQNGWGTASSPILYENLVIVAASAESKAVVAINKDTGKIVCALPKPRAWAAFGALLCWLTAARDAPTSCSPGRKLFGASIRARERSAGSATPSLPARCAPVQSPMTACSTCWKPDPRGAERWPCAGGEGDVTKTHVLWRGKERSRIVTPVYADGRVYWVSSRMANCIDAATGKLVYQSPRLGGGRPRAEQSVQSRQRIEQTRRRRPRHYYSSPLLANGNIYWLARTGETIVFARVCILKLRYQELQ